MPFCVITQTVSFSVWIPIFHNCARSSGVAIECHSFETMLEAFLSSIYLVMMGSSGKERFRIVLEAFLSSHHWSMSLRYAAVAILMADRSCSVKSLGFLSVHGIIPCCGSRSHLALPIHSRCKGLYSPHFLEFAA